MLNTRHNLTLLNNTQGKGLQRFGIILYPLDRSRNTDAAPISLPSRHGARLKRILASPQLLRYHTALAQEYLSSLTGCRIWLC